MDLAQLGPHLTPILTVAILVSAIKPFLEVRIPRTAPLHDAAIRLLAIGLGLAGMLADYLLHTSHASGPGVETALGAGLLAGVGAILTYHLVAGDLFDGPLQTAQSRSDEPAKAG
jgi:hypothetical protein